MYCIQVLQTIEGEQKHLFRRKSGGALNGGKFVTTPTSDSVRASTEPIFQNHSKRLVFKQKCYLLVVKIVNVPHVGIPGRFFLEYQLNGSLQIPQILRYQFCNQSKVHPPHMQPINTHIYSGASIRVLLMTISHA